MNAITLVSYNIHKGMSPLGRHATFSSMAKKLSELKADIWCLQEVQGKNERCPPMQHKERNAQDKQLGAYLSAHYHYGKNAIYPNKHHGNAILSRFALDWQGNHNISTNRFEQRGILHCRTQPSHWQTPIEILCVHLNLLHRDRIKQYQAISDYINRHIDQKAPLILAGDFNDWQKQSTALLSQLDMIEVFEARYGTTPATFPAKFPLISLDRIYIKNLNASQATVHHDKAWATLSDHLPISATLHLPNY